MNAENFHASLDQALEDSYKPTNMPPEPAEGEERQPWTTRRREAGVVNSRATT